MATACVKGGTQALSCLLYTEFPGASVVKGKWIGSMNMEFVFSLLCLHLLLLALLAEICFPVPLHLLINMSMSPELSSSFL